VSVLVIGAGAAGLASAIFAARAAPGLQVTCLDGARSVGAKILVSGGSRCNVTNRVVTEQDFWGGSSRVVRRVLRAFPADRAAAFFESLGVGLHEEEDGKLFPDTNRSRTVLEALLREASRLGVVIEAGRRVIDIRPAPGGFVVEAADAPGRARASAAPATSVRYEAGAVVLATGGRSLPKSGSDGSGYELARRLGHGLVETTPALAPLVLDPHPHVALAGVAHEVALTLFADGRAATRLQGSMLWTHVGISGPVALNMSRHWHRARLDGRPLEVRASLCPGETFESIERWWLAEERARPRARVATALSTRVPASVAGAWIHGAGLDGDLTLAHVSREDRRRLLHALLETRLPVRDSRGYSHAEVTAGGVPLDEIDPATMESRRCPGLFLVGEMLDVDGRLGGFNFQWSWSTGWVAGQAVGRRP
jgi:predicted Rossmann fold flavoprotein